MASPLLYPTADTSAEGLIEQIKNIQRSDPAAKEQWIAFTDLQGGGKRDPAKHTPELLQDFLTHLGSGGRLEVGGGADFGAAIKLLQKRAPSVKAVWAQFCMMNGGGRNDPSKHDGAFHTQFFEMLAQTASMGGGGGDMGMGGPAKRMRDGSGMAMGMMGGGSAKDMLVGRLKAFQRSSPDNKELWGTYADTYLGGVRDPTRHDEQTIQEFCVNHQVPRTVAWAVAWAAAWPAPWIQRRSPG